MFKSLSEIIQSEDSKLNTEESYLKSVRKNITKQILNNNPEGFIVINPETGLSKPRIVSAAIQNELGDIIVGARHYDCHMRMQLKLHDKIHELLSMFSSHDSINFWGTGANIEQGFIDQHGNYYSRKDAWLIAKDNDQIIRIVPGCEGTLYSENLY